MSALFGGEPPSPTQHLVQSIPEPPKATPMADEAAIARKKKQALTRQQSRGGRLSTILSDSETLG